ncbi:MAG: efflux RND transporter periplasmic adaptor subunit [Deltaproteobacteria bacterium]|jgi:multidrug efflux system membrane fusion protein|nr:efflux RND transporter periplasmic adaptor subunit [Deltaproteobacteria bacterium]
MFNSRIFFSFPALLLLVFLTLFAGGCSDKEDTAQGGRPVPVRTAAVTVDDVQQTLAVIGHVEPSASVSVASQVNGQLLEVLVKPGHYVKAGQILFRLDRRALEASLKQAEAMLARDNAQLRRARQDLARYKALADRNYTSRQQYEQSLSEVESLEAVIAEDTAIIDSAKVELGHTEISAPLSGRVGEILLDPGNIVKAGDMRLLLINTISPAKVSFSVPEKHLPELNRRMRQGKVEVRVLPEGDVGAPASGALSSIDNAVDRDTGSISMQAAFPNTDERLWPGQFVRVYIVMEAVPDARIIPFRAALEGMTGQYVYVVDSEHRVMPRPVKSYLIGNNRLQISDGLDAGEIVVTDGQLNLYPGAKVEIVSGDLPPRPPAPPDTDQDKGPALQTPGIGGIGLDAPPSLQPLEAVQSGQPDKS